MNQLNQRFLGGLSAALVVSSFGLATSSYGSDASVLQDDGSEELVPGALASAESTAVEDTTVENSLDSASEVSSAQSSFASAEPANTESSSDELDSLLSSAASPVAVIHSHVLDGRDAATVYVRGIPIVTFLGDDAIARATSVVEETSQQDELNELEAASEESSDDATAVDASATENKGVQPLIATEKQVSPESSSDATQSDKSVSPVQSAAAIAERLNRLYTSDIDPNNIIAAWNEDDDAFVIRAGEDVLVEFNSSTILPDTTGSLSEDVLQATNRIRRQFGAEPLTEIDGLPSASRSTVATGPVRSTFTGPASWYGPGFHGRRSASGEVFNQNAMTAAHRTLPFGTVVRVTNMTSGASVVVRINDRGPFGGGRVLDLSAGAARAIGMIQAGVANVRVDVLDAR